MFFFKQQKVKQIVDPRMKKLRDEIPRTDSK